MAGLDPAIHALLAAPCWPRLAGRAMNTPPLVIDVKASGRFFEKKLRKKLL